MPSGIPSKKKETDKQKHVSCPWIKKYGAQTLDQCKACEYHQGVRTIGRLRTLYVICDFYLIAPKETIGKATQPNTIRKVYVITTRYVAATAVNQE